MEERKRVYDIVGDEARGEWLIAAHVTHTSARDMLALARRLLKMPRLSYKQAGTSAVSAARAITF